MKFKSIEILVAATICGYLGGSVAPQFGSVEAQDNTVVRTTRIELIDSSGRTRATLAVDDASRRGVLMFLDAEGKLASSIDEASVKLFGKDGKLRVSLSRGEFDHPRLVMGDELLVNRIVLGAFEGDYNPTPAETYWALKMSGRNVDAEPVQLIVADDPKMNVAVGGLIIINPYGSLKVPETTGR